MWRAAGICRNKEKQDGGLEEQETMINWFPLGAWGVIVFIRLEADCITYLVGRRPFEAVGAHLDRVE